jgi:diguanylate cyclase (GGDEF)-like protein
MAWLLGITEGRLRQLWAAIVRRFPQADPFGKELVRTVLIVLSRFRRVLSTVPWTRGALASATMLLVLYLTDRALGFPLGLRMLYMLPIWIGLRIGGLGVGLGGVAVVSLLMGDIESASLGALGKEQTIASMVLRTASMLILTLVIAHVEARLQDAETKASTDLLTGVLNRREIERLAEETLIAARANNRTFCVALIDCDHFKEANDTYGHAFGDHVLRMLARRLQIGAGSFGFVGRIGGDEFLVLFPTLDLTLADARMAGAKHNFERYMASLGCPITMSYGLVEFAGDETLAQLLHRADERMYGFKHAAARAVVEPSAAPPVRR